MLTGENCCMDITGAIKGWKSAAPNWQKTCCNNPNSFVQLPKDISGKEKQNVNKYIGSDNMKALKQVNTFYTF